MEFIIDYWWLAVIIGVIIGLAIVFIRKFLQKSTEEQIDKVREWLIGAVAIAEKELGSGMGIFKLRKVYDIFLTKFPFLVKIISFEKFSKLVDEALVKFKKILESNKAAQEYVNNNTQKE